MLECLKHISLLVSFLLVLVKQKLGPGGKIAHITLVSLQTMFFLHVLLQSCEDLFVTGLAYNSPLPEQEVI